MVAGLQILSSGFMGSIRGQNIGAKNKIHPNILGVAMAYQSLLKRANHANLKDAIRVEYIIRIKIIFEPLTFPDNVEISRSVASELLN